MHENILSLIINGVFSCQAHEEIVYHKDDILHPETLGFRKDFGEPVGQIGDYRLTMEDGSSVHAREYDNDIGFHWDLVDPGVDWFEHLRRDSPHWYVISNSIAGAGIGALLTLKTKNWELVVKSAIACGLLGFLFGLITSE